MPDHWPRPWPFREPPADAAVEPLTAAGARRLPLSWTSRFSPSSLAAHVQRHPGYGWIAPALDEYLIAEPWRRRDDVTLLLELHGRRALPALLAAARRALAGAGTGALVLADDEWALRARFYQAQGFARLERVVYFQLLGLSPAPLATRRLPALDPLPFAPAAFDALVALDHAAFPWLWWNSAAEFRAYAAQPDVQIWLGHAAGRLVAYAGFTTAPPWGHLDRLAVDPAWHGRGYGAAMLAFALAQLAARGIHRVTLSTQATNIQSQRLYQGFGFRPTGEATDVYGMWLGDSR